jgi:methyl-accepting chemotaxis protein
VWFLYNKSNSKGPFMKLNTKLCLGSIGMVLLCGLTASYGIFSLKSSIHELTGTAWETNVTSNQVSKNVHEQLLIVKEILANENNEQGKTSLREKGKQTVTAITNLVNNSSFDQQELKTLNSQHEQYQVQLDLLLNSLETYSRSKERFNNISEELISLGEVLDVVGDEALDGLESQPELQLSWNTGLKERWFAADGGMESGIGFLTQSYYLQLLLSGADYESTQKQLLEAQEFHRDAMNTMISSGYFKGPLNKEEKNSPIMEVAYQKAFDSVVENRNVLIKDYVAFRDSLKNYETSGQNLLNSLNQLDTKVNGFIQGINQQAQARVSFSIFLVLTAMAVGIGISLYGAWSIAQSITKPLEESARVLTFIAQGDLTERINLKATGEVGVVVNSVNRITESFQSTMQQIVEAVQSLTQSAEMLSTTASQMDSSARESSTRSESASNSAHSMSQDIVSISMLTRKVSSEVTQVSTSLEEITQSIGEIARSSETSAQVSNRAAELTQGCNQEIQILNSAAQEISQIINVIQDIADQTNLLALNATIESARAGEAGKGFAVVANEVKELAKQSSASTEDIRRRVDAILSSTGRVITSIKNVEDVVTEVKHASQCIASAVQQQRATSSNISENFNIINSSTRDVALRVDNSAKSSELISENVTQVSQQINLTNQGVSNTLISSKSLAVLAQDLSKMVESFKVSKEAGKRQYAKSA